RLTTYHIDRECNYLFQVFGEKTISIFDAHDREVLPEVELERFWTVDNNAAVYKEQFQCRAHQYRLVPGTGVHIPINAPHSVQNGPGISVTMAIVFQLPDSHLGNVYRANYYLRKLGLTPAPPGRSNFRDSLKAYMVGASKWAAKQVRRLGRLKR